MLASGGSLIDINSDLSNKDFTFDANLGTSFRDRTTNLVAVFII